MCVCLSKHRLFKGLTTYSSCCTYWVAKGDIISRVHVLLGTVGVIVLADEIRPEAQGREVSGMEHQHHGCRTYSTWHFYDRLWNRNHLNRKGLPCWVLDCVWGTRYRNTHMMWDGVTQWIVHSHNKLTGVLRNITLADVQQQAWLQRDSSCFRSFRLHFVSNKLTGKEQSCVNWCHICKIQPRPKKLKLDVKCNTSRYEISKTRARLHSQRNSNKSSILPSCKY
jgi:hypothetical protein